MPTSDAVLLPPPLPTRPASPERVLGEHRDAPGSSRRLDDVGVENVLEAMIEQRRQSSRPAPAAAPIDEREAAASHGHAPSVRARAASDVFVKVR